MESLNLLRYLIIRDKVTENQVSITAGVLIPSSIYQGTLPAKKKKTEAVTVNDGVIDFLFLVIKLPARKHFPSVSVVSTPHIFPAADSILQTGIWTELYKIEDTFMKPLRVGVNMSRAHYERELHNTMESKKSKAKGLTNTHMILFSVPLFSKHLIRFLYTAEPVKGANLSTKSYVYWSVKIWNPHIF